MANPKFTVIIPVYNEGRSLDELTNKITQTFANLNETNSFEIFFVDDGSTDDSCDVINKLSRTYSYVNSISFGRNQGKAMALMAAFYYARGDILITMDGDLQDDPQEIPLFLAKLEEGYDVVSGYRKQRFHSLIRNLGSKLFNSTVSCVSGLNLHDFNCGFKAIKSHVVKKLMVFGQFHRFIPLLSFYQGFKVTEVAVVNHQRKYGSSKYPAIRFNSVFDLLSILFISRYQFSPLYFFGKISLALIIPSLLILGYLVVSHFLYLADMSAAPLINRPLLFFALFGIMIGVNIGLIGFFSDFYLHHSMKKNLQDVVNEMIDDTSFDD